MRELLVVALLAVAISHMIVQSPATVVEIFAKKYPDGKIPFSIANYGVVPYGKTISGQIGTPSVLQDCVFEQLQDSSVGAKILLVQRNDCSFTQKSINVQKEGGKLAVVIDSVVEDSQLIVMKDDGKGHQVKIPTVLISLEDGLILVEALKQGGVVLSVTFQVETRSASSLQLWLDISDHQNFVFLRNLQPYFQKIKQHVQMKVGYPTSRCVSDCIADNCYYNGKYCKYPDSNGWGVQDAGKLIIREQLRQHYIFQEDQSKWWNYVLYYDDECIDLVIIEECSAKIIKRLGLDKAKINNLVEKSFGSDDNEVLKFQSELKYNNSIIYYPSVVVNNFVYRGNKEPFEVYELICESLTPQPEGCDGFISINSTSNIGAYTTIGVISVLVFCIFLVFCYRRLVRRQLSSTMNKQVNQLVNEYITMYENDKFSQGAELTSKKGDPTIQ